MARYQGEELYSYEKMGFFKLLLAIEDKKILKDYEKEQLGEVLAYDKEHSSDYTETLYQFLLHQGSIQGAAAAMFCHRNTVNYRMKVLRESRQPGWAAEMTPIPPDLETAPARDERLMPTPIPPWIIGYFAIRFPIFKFGSMLKFSFTIERTIPSQTPRRGCSARRARFRRPGNSKAL